MVAGWIARLEPNELDAARAELKGAGFPNPAIRNFDDRPLDARALGQPLDVLMDVEPRNAETMALAGRSLDQHPVLGPMLARAMAEGKPIASDPLPLLRPDGADRPGAGRAGSAGRRRRSRRVSSPFPTTWRR